MTKQWAVMKSRSRQEIGEAKGAEWIPPLTCASRPPRQATPRHATPRQPVARGNSRAVSQSQSASQSMILLARQCRRPESVVPPSAIALSPRLPVPVPVAGGGGGAVKSNLSQQLFYGELAAPLGLPLIVFVPRSPSTSMAGRGALECFSPVSFCGTSSAYQRACSR